MIRDLNYCLTNDIFVEYKEVFLYDKYTKSTLSYPVLYNLKNSKINKDILNDISSLIYSDIQDFNQGLLDESIQYNSTVSNKNIIYKSMSSYNVTMNKNNILSIIVNLIGFSESTFPLYNQINSYNYDLSTGKTINLKDVFKPNVNYKKLLSSKLAKETNMNTIEITDAQSFYLTNDGIIIYFGIDEVPGYKNTIPKFKISFGDIYAYTNSKYLCVPTNITTK